MARRPEKRLSPRGVASEIRPGRHADGNGLYLVVEASGSKHWLFIYRSPNRAGRTGPGRQREMGLGSYINVGLAGAREMALEARQLIGQGKDPIDVRRAQAAIPSFLEVAKGFIALRERTMRNEKSKARLSRALLQYAASLHHLPVDEVDINAVKKVLDPIWTAKASTAKEVRGLIAGVLDKAAASGHRSSDNPARSPGPLDHLLPKRNKLGVKHHASMPLADVPGFIKVLQAKTTSANLAMEFIILTAARTGEALEATWPEIDLKEKLWSIPGARMKSGRPHQVPLTERAMAILAKARALHDGALVFPGQDPKVPLSNMTLRMRLRRAGLSATTHGFRSTFRDWAGDHSPYPREVAEAALAHQVGDATEQAYRRSDALTKRRAMMESWASFCAGGEIGGQVLAFQNRSAATERA